MRKLAGLYSPGFLRSHVPKLSAQLRRVDVPKAHNQYREIAERFGAGLFDHRT